MSFGVDASENYLTWGNVEPIRLTSRAKSGDVLFDISVAKLRAPTKSELIASGGVYIKSDIICLVPKTLADAAGAIGLKAPKPGDKIAVPGISDYGLLTILECPLNTLRSTYRCMTRDLILAYELRGTLHVRRPAATTTTDDAGGRTYENMETVYNAIPCRIQENASGESDERGKRATVRRFTVTVDRRLYLTVEDVIVDTETNEVYAVESWDNADRIDQLQTIQVSKRWGTISDGG